VAVHPVGVNMCGVEGPAAGELPCLYFSSCPAIAGLCFEFTPVRAARRGNLTILTAGLREAGGALHALGLPLHCATLAVATGLAQIVARFRLTDVAVGEYATTGQQRQRCRDVIELDLCCHTFLCSIDVGSQVGRGVPRYTPECGNPAILDDLSLDRRLCVLAFQPVCQMTT